MDVFVAKLNDASLGSAERHALADTNAGIATYRRGQTIVAEDAHPQQLHLVSRGWAARSRSLENGSRQTTDFVIPGELCDLSALGSGPMEKVVALTPLQAVLLDRTALLAAMARHPKLATALLRLAFNEQAVLRVWLTCLGQLRKHEHLAHLFCELHERLRRAGLADDHEFELPLTQDQLGEALGMTSVHTNRVLQRLRHEGLVDLGDHHLRILHPRQLRDIAAFDAAYLNT